LPHEPDYYQTLQVSPRAKPYVIEAAYKNLARRYHPDLNPNPDAHQRMAELNRAIEVLRDPRRREEYDRRRIRALAQTATAARSPALIFGMVNQARYSIVLRESLRQLSLGWLVFVGGLVVALVGTAAMVTQLVSDSGSDRESSNELKELIGLDGPSGTFHAEAAEPGASHPAQAGAPLTPTPTASPGPDGSTTPQALSAIRDDTRPGANGAVPAAATPTPAAIAVPTPAPPPGTSPASTPPPATPAPPPSPAPTPACSAAGAPQINENGNQVSFTSGDVVSFDASQPDLLVVDIAGTVLQIEITAATDVQGDLDSATIVNGDGRRTRDGTITAQLVEVVCPA
jgi:curved DNA-binding protein CbpA